MATFLQLCRDVARESGTVAGVLPQTVTGQTGQLAKIVSWTDAAWREIQNRRSSWQWMRAEWQGETTAGAPRYTAASFNLTRWAAWITEEGVTTIYDPVIGVSDEGDLRFIDWAWWRRIYDRGEQQENRPRHFSISPSGQFCPGPIPDATYVVRGEYRKSPQTLSADGDVPEMPARFHDLITWRALILLGEHDEGEIQMAIANRRARELMDDLCRDQLPEVHVSSEPVGGGHNSRYIGGTRIA